MKKYLLFLLLLIALQNSKAQSSHFKFDHFTVKDGLPSNNGLPEPDINFIKQDDQGYLWIGTHHGLVRYNGYNVKIYIFGSVTGDVTTQNYQVLTMVSDENKNLWFSTVGNGLFRYNRSTDSFTQYKYPKKEGIYLQYLTLADSKGDLWGSSMWDDFSFDAKSGKVNFEMSFDRVRFDPKTKHFDYFGTKQKGTHYLNSPNDLLKSSAPGHPIWVGTNTGLSVYNDRDNTFHPYFSASDAARQKSVNHIYEAPSEPGILWLNVFDHFSKQNLVERFDTRDKTFKDYRPANNPGLTISNDAISDVYEDGRQRLWFASAGGLMYFDRKTETFTNYSPTDTVANKNKIYSITEAKNGSLWLRCAKGLLNFDTETHRFVRCTANINDAGALSSNTVSNLLVDRSGTLWAGISGKGIDKLNDLTSSFTTYTYDDKAPAKYSPLNGIGLISSPADGYLWFSNKQGIYKWKPGSDQFIQVYKASKTDGDMQMFTLGKKGIVYFSNGKGLRVYDPVSRKLQNYPIDTSKAASRYSNYISRAVQDRTGLVWFGTYDKGLYSFNPVSHQFTSYPFPDSKRQKGGKSKTIPLIFEDRCGTIWIGTEKDGLNSFDQNTKKFKSYLLSGSKATENINNIYEDKAGHLWVGTEQNGLFEFHGESGTGARIIYKDKGLLFRYISGINEDNKGFIWVSADDSLSRVNPNNMSVKTFPWDVILPGANRQSGLHSLPAGNGQMVIGIDNGIAVFNPHDMEANHYPPVVHIEKLIYSDPVSKSDSVSTRLAAGINKAELPYSQNRITFNYVALHFTSPAQNRYAYTLEGYDNRWIQAGTLRSATYTNLSPGTYTFRVRAANSDGVWNNRGDNFILIIDAPWWQKWWAWIMYVMLFASAIYAFVYYRSRQLMKDKRLLEEQVQIRTEEVLHQKEEIESQRDNLENQRNTLEQTLTELKTTQNHLIQSEKMASLGELTAGIAHEIQNPLNFVNNFSEVSVELLDELKQEVRAGNNEEVMAIADDLSQNLGKISQHGKRADSIVKGMLEHSRSRSGQKEPTDINIIAGEFMRLSYHGLRSKDKTFNSELITHFDADLPKIAIVQQDIGRVLLNLFNNAFYAVNQRAKTSGPDYRPEVTVSTSLENGRVVIKVKDNGIGIPDAIKEKIMQPFFTTKPTGEGTGLGLSLTYDMVVKGHGGSIKVDSVENEYTLFTIQLPLS